MGRKNTFTRRTWLRGTAAFIWVPSVSSDIEQFTGTYAYWGTKAGEGKRLRAVDNVVADIPWGFQWIARKRILETNPILARLDFSPNEGALKTKLTGMPLIRGPLDWSTFQWTDEHGDRIHVQQKVRGRVLTQQFRKSEGSRKFTYSLRGKWLRFGLDLRSPKLSRPIQYWLWYLRQ